MAALQLDVPETAVPELTVRAVDEGLDAIASTTGAGSAARRRSLLADLFTRATPDEQRFLVRLLTGELRQGALEGLMLEAVASAAGVPADTAPADSLDAALAELGEVSVEYKLDGARIRYRSDKNARDADSIDAVRALLTISR